MQTLLTFMLFLMPFLISSRESSRPGLHTGLWTSLFFWGRVHPFFSILIFSLSVVYYIFQRKPCPGGQTKSFTHAGFWVPRPGARPLTAFLSILIIFCAFGNVSQDYAVVLNLDEAIQHIALFLGFSGSLTGPIIFGLLSDKKGPFSAFITLLFLGITGIGCTALSFALPHLLPVGSFLMQSVIAGIFSLMPLLLLKFYGRPQISVVLPFLLLFLSGLWSASLRFYKIAEGLSHDYLLTMVFLLLMATLLIYKAWRQRLTVL